MKTVYWIEGAPGLAIVSRPRGRDWLEDDLRRLKDEGLDVIVSLLTADEDAELGLEGERIAANDAGIEFLSFPIVDRATPAEPDRFSAFVGDVVGKIRNGRRVGAHCRSCIGRATILTAAVLADLGWNGKSSLAAIEQARGCTVPDTDEQRRWIESFAARREAERRA